MLGIPRMAAKLRPAGRQTTPPGRAGEFPACGAAKQPIFEVVFGASNSAQPCRPLRRKAICQGQAPAVRGTGSAGTDAEECERAWRELRED